MNLLRIALFALLLPFWTPTNGQGDMSHLSNSLEGVPAVKPKNIILMIGDGMGLSQISTLYLNRDRTAFDHFPVVGFQKTHSCDNLVTDSAAGATAISTGVKTTNSSIALDSQGVILKTILEEAADEGLATGLVVTSSIVHATPAAFVSHSTTRYDYETIAEYIPSSKIDFFIGGGKKYFSRREQDHRDLIGELRAAGFSVYDYYHSDLYSVRPNPNKRFAFFTADNQPLPAMQDRDYLPYAATLAIDYLKQRSQKGFFLMVEGSQIDWAGHSNQAKMLDFEMRDFEETILAVLRWAKVDGQTLVIVTADHETGGLALTGTKNAAKVEYTYQTNAHTATMVPVFAYGPGAELFRGIYENTGIHARMERCLGLDQQP